MIIRGGENVYPREIEEILHAHPSVQEAQVKNDNALILFLYDVNEWKILTFDCVVWIKVVGVPDERLGEEICAWIRCKPQTNLDSLELKKFCSEKVAVLFQQIINAQLLRWKFLKTDGLF